MKPDDFEKTLQRQSLRQIPTEWRAEILQAARSAGERLPTFEPRASWLSTLNQRLSAVLWPHPKAWAGLAAAWIVIAVANSWSGNDQSVAATAPVAPPPRDLLDVVREQHRELVRLIEPSATGLAERPRTFSPRPRSDRCPDFSIG